MLTREFPWIRRAVTAVALILVATSAVGCSSIPRDPDSGMFDMTEMLSVSHIRGPLQRRLDGTDSALDSGTLYSPEARKALTDAKNHLDAKQYNLAERDYKRLAKKYKETALGEEAQFQLAETYYARGYYGKAQDAYDQLFEDYPSTRYVETATRRLFRIARDWLEIAEPESRSEIVTVSHEAGMDASSDNSEPPKGDSRPPSVRYRVLPNFFDKSRPLFDTQGNAVKALKSIWLNDPTGPLADDAIMLTATYHQRHRNYPEADRFYQILREEYPDSPYLEKAFVLGSHVKLMSYQGPHYESRNLTGARKLKEQAIQLFPASFERQQLRTDLQKLYLLEAEAQWGKVQYYQRKRDPDAIALACLRLIRDYPDTRFAAEARQILFSIDRKYLQHLPEINEILDSIPPPTEERPEPARTQPRVKSVSDSRADESDTGRVRL
ncbi:MAG: tetratricopeptide repeat protein [Planctomycetaceae bacterium]|nr:tetratricopeptide repeat protein [Planctomycetaceae bacterium]